MVYINWEEFITSHSTNIFVKLKFLYRPHKYGLYGIGIKTEYLNCFPDVNLIKSKLNNHIYNYKTKHFNKTYLYSQHICIYSNYDKFNKGPEDIQVNSFKYPDYMMIDVDGVKTDNSNILENYQVLDLIVELKNIFGIDHDILVNESPTGVHLIFKCLNKQQFEKIIKLKEKYPYIDKILKAMIIVWWPGKDEPILAEDIII